MVTDREEIRRLVREEVGGRPVRWMDSRTARGAFLGWEWALEVFDVPFAEQEELHGKLFRGIRKRLWEEKRVAITVFFHTPENTERYYSWIRAEHAADLAGAS